MSAVIDKVIALHQLNIPYEIVEEINSFCFYDEMQAKAKKIKNDVHQKIVDAFIGNEINGQWWFQAGVFDQDNVSHENQFQGMNCLQCGDYISANNMDYSATNVICLCLYFQPYTFYNPNENDTHWIENEQELDPIQSEYDDFRYDYHNNV
jgi:hypothetical protein